jgi:stage II sporulation protein D
MSSGYAPVLHVGILRADRIRFRLEGRFSMKGAIVPEGPAEAVAVEDRIELLQDGKKVASGKELLISPADPGKGRIMIMDVVIGIGFHWERKEDQLFTGALKLMYLDGKVSAINLVPLEDYLVSVISSEMSGDNVPALLRAHAIVSRSWLLAQIKQQGSPAANQDTVPGPDEQEGEYIRWYDRGEHRDFHVCSDDHCQRYQGITRALHPRVKKAVRDTAGEVLEFEGRICDARFSKCCGGVTERFESCWEPVAHPYLRRVEDRPESAGRFPDLRVEGHAVRFIKGSPEVFCNTKDKDLPGQVLNDYDRSSADFFRWRVEYSQEELAGLIRERSGIDFGGIRDLVPVERGESGRLVRMKIVGTHRTLVVGKELEIRRWMSRTHLYSSAFTVEKTGPAKELPQKFILYGAGWGHGVGLCQIGAAVMASRGYSHTRILKHYYKGAEIVKRYEPE